MTGLESIRKERQRKETLRHHAAVIVALSSIVILASFSFDGGANAAEGLPAAGREMIKKYCADCHMDGADEGNVSFSLTAIDWDKSGQAETWESVYQMVSRDIMPPPDAEQPDETERDVFLQWLDGQLVDHLPIGGGVIRRLSRREYENSLRAVFQLPRFELPLGFPPDNEQDGFDNQASALAIAPSHLEAYVETANQLADEFFPPPPQVIPARTVEVPAHELVVSYSSACLIDGAMRLASSGSNIVRNATWPSKFEAPASGKYMLDITVSAAGVASDESATLRVASMLSTRGNTETVQDLVIAPGKQQSFQIEVDLERGETVVMRYLDGPLNYEDKAGFPDFLTDLFTKEPVLAAAWDAVGEPPRGGSGWERVKEMLESPELDRERFVNDQAGLQKLIQRMAKKSVNTGETLVYKYFEEGPYIAIEGLSISGPTDQRPDADQLRVARQRQRFLGAAEGQSDPESLQKFYESLLTKIFRRPATKSEINSYVALVRDAVASGATIDEGHHLALRTALLSPSFLFITDGSDDLSEHELAARLAYFLTSGPPDDALLTQATAGKIENSKTLRKQADRLIGKDFCRDFTGQWLGLSTLESLMPDKRLISKFTSQHRNAMIDEVTESFHHVLENNLPVSELISPDFVFTDPATGWEIYQLEQFKPPAKKRKASYRSGMQKVEVPRDGRRGGLLCMPGVMMATANGVDTQPVLRGVWMLNNVLGSPPPEPPNSVPALTPDTTGASSPKERLAAHMNEASCAVCHREIDPLGFVLENFDPIGRWRDHYPDFSASAARESKDRNAASAPEHSVIDATGTLPGGYELQDVTDLKRFLTDNPEIFARCLGEKLLTYATGHRLNHRERDLVAEIVRQQNAANDLKLRDLLFALIDSEVFRTK